MSVTIEELAQRVEAMEHRLDRLARLVDDPNADDRPPTDGTIYEWLARVRRRNAALGSIEDLRRAMGIPADIEPKSAKEIREMMIAEGVNPDDCIASREIIRMREEE